MSDARAKIVEVLSTTQKGWIAPPDWSLYAVALLAAYPQIARAMEPGMVVEPDWQPIETAPKDGFFQVWSPDFPNMCVTFKAEIFWLSRAEGTPSHLSGNHWTLWRPLHLPAASDPAP